MRLVWLVIANLSSAPLHNTMAIVGDEVVYVGTIEKGKSVEVELPYKDGIRVIFTLGQKREDWLEVRKMSMRDTICIDDKTTTFEVEILEIEN